METACANTPNSDRMDNLVLFTEDLDKAVNKLISDKPASTEEIPDCTSMGSDEPFGTPARLTSYVERKEGSSFYQFGRRSSPQHLQEHLNWLLRRKLGLFNLDLMHVAPAYSTLLLISISGCL